MFPKDKATTAAIIGNTLTFQVLQKVRAVPFSSPFFPVSSSDENKALQGSQSSSFVLTVAGKEGGGGEGLA